MYLHFDVQTLQNDLWALLDGFTSAALGYDRHRNLAKRLADTNCSERKQAKITVVANCADCGSTLYKDLMTIWQNGSPVHISLLDRNCPYCQGKTGFHYASTHALHA